MERIILPLLLKDIYINKRSGILRFQFKDIDKTMYLKNGQLIFAETNQENERLGQILYKIGKISEAHLKKIHLYLDKDKKLGKVLVEKGIISPKDLYEGWIRQMEVIVTNMFPYIDAIIDFQEMDIEVAKEFTFTISLPYIIVQGIRKMKFLPIMEETVSKGIPYLKGRESIYFLNDLEKEILKSIDGFTPVSKLFPGINLTSEEFLKSLFLFYCLNIIDFKKGEKEETKVGTEDKEIERNLEEVLAIERELDRLNYYQILKVSPNASPNEIKKSYFLLAKLYHPDKFAKKAPQDLVKKAQRVFMKITKAYQTLIDSEKRKKYDASPKEEKADKSKEAELKFRKAKALYKQGKYREAIAFVQDAIRLKKEKGSYFLLLALAQARIPAFRKKAEENFMEAIKLEPWNPECYVGLGLLYKSENMIIRASKQFEKALSIDPEHPIANKELESIKGKKEKLSLKDILKSDLSSLFKKK